MIPVYPDYLFSQKAKITLQEHTKDTHHNPYADYAWWDGTDQLVNNVSRATKRKRAMNLTDADVHPKESEATESRGKVIT